MDQLHKRMDALKCSTCSRIFTRSENLRRHEREQHGNQSAQHICPICLKSFLRIYNLREHIKIAHLDPPAAVSVQHPAPEALSVPSSTKTSAPHPNDCAQPGPSGMSIPTDPNIQTYPYIEDSIQPGPQHMDIQTGNCSEEMIRASILHCSICNLNVAQRSYLGHINSKAHRDRAIVNVDGEVQTIATAMNARIKSLRIINPLRGTDDDIDFSRFTNQIREHVVQVLSDSLREHTTIRWNLIVYVRYRHGITETEVEKSFIAPFRTSTQSSDLAEMYQEAVECIGGKILEFDQKDSGWSMEEILYAEINTNKVDPMCGGASSYICLPSSLRCKRSILNIKNEDEECFKWCILAALHPTLRNPQRVANYRRYQNELDFTGMTFPMKISDIKKFERYNGISVNVYELKFNTDTRRYNVIGPIHLTSCLHRERHVNLLLLIDDSSGKTHYCLIKHLSRLVSSQINSREHKKFFCDGCLNYFSSKARLQRHNQHDCAHVHTRLPDPNINRKNNYFDAEISQDIMCFMGYGKTMRTPVVIYCDFECLLEPIQPPVAQQNPAPRSYNVQRHIPYSFGYYLQCSFEQQLSRYRSHRGVDCISKFLSYIKEDAIRMWRNYLNVARPMQPLTVEEQIEHDNSTHCHICERAFTAHDLTVYDHCHLTSQYRGRAHTLCNLQYAVPKWIPIIAHNMSSYDSHLFIKSLARDEDFYDMDVLANNSEKYISFSVKLKTGSDGEFVTLKFADSLRFLTASLEKLGENLSTDQCRSIRKYFPDREKFDLIRQKGVFPYSFLDSFQKLDDVKSLPPAECFYDNLRKEGVNPEAYARAQRVWQTFHLNTLGEYADLYLQSDVLLLTDIFECYRDVCLKTYRLDPCNYLTAPSLSFDAMLRHTGVKLQLLTDIDMLHFFRLGVRGGLCQVSKRFAEANNKFLTSYNVAKPSSYIMYLDATNLYGAAMSEPLPYGDFSWVEYLNEFTSERIATLEDDAPEGYIFEVDLMYPPELHEAHNDLPFCPERMVPPGGRQPKLIANLNDKKNYIIHYRNLKQALGHGLKLVKVHRILKFKQSRWLKSYIDLNTRMRNASTNEASRDFFKRAVNSMFGKTMENVLKRRQIHLVNRWEDVGKRRGARRILCDPRLKSYTIFDENFLAIEMNKSSVLFDKPIYLGFCILDLSKTIMYEFLYDYLKRNFTCNLLYTDTDSLIIEVFTDNFYENMRIDCDRFDTSNYPTDNIHNIPRTLPILGRMKDECPLKFIQSFVGLMPKCYAVKMDGDQKQNSEIKRAKGVSTGITRNELHMQDYIKVLQSKEPISREMYTFRSERHNVFTKLVNKIALASRDDKRHSIENSDETLAVGHYRLSNG